MSSSIVGGGLDSLSAFEHKVTEPAGFVQHRLINVRFHRAFNAVNKYKKYFPVDRPPGRKDFSWRPASVPSNDRLIRLRRFSTLRNSVVLSLDTEQPTAA